MTPKEALELLKSRILQLSKNHKIGNRDIANLEIKDIVTGIEIHVIPAIETTINELEALKKPPTVDEVCALIEKDIKGKATYSHGQFYIDNEKVDDILFGVFRSKTLLAIGRFYEGLEVKE